MAAVTKRLRCILIFDDFDVMVCLGSWSVSCWVLSVEFLYEWAGNAMMGSLTSLFLRPFQVYPVSTQQANVL